MAGKQTSFTDRFGDKWVMNVSVLTLKTIRDELGVNLGIRPDIATNFGKLTSDDVLVAYVAYHGAKPFDVDVKVSFEKFAANLKGDLLDEVRKAVLYGWAEFWGSKDREVINKAIDAFYATPPAPPSPVALAVAGVAASV